MTQQEVQEITEKIAAMPAWKAAKAKNYVNSLYVEDDDEFELPADRSALERLCKLNGIDYSMFADVKYDPNASFSESVAQWKASLGDIAPVEWDKGVDEFVASLRSNEIFEPRISF